MDPIEQTEEIPAPAKGYIGDSVYIEFDGYYITLTTNNGYPDDPRNRIALEPDVIAKLKAYIKQVEAYRADYLKRHP